MTAEDVDAWLQAYRGHVPGASVLVVEHGSPRVRVACGCADLERGEPTTPATNYRLASLTKQFTAAAIALLVEDGRLGFDDRVRDWLPSLPGSIAPVTLRQLLTHTAGLIDYEDLIAPGATEALRDADVLALLEREDRSYFPPGTAYRYSNGGYALLALTVERAAGTRFAAFLRRRLFEPLGMHRTVAFEAGISTVPHRAYGYSAVGGAWVRTDQNATSSVLGDGGIYSSIDDLAKWDAALYDDRLLGAGTRRSLFTPTTPTDDPAVRYAMGWRVSGETWWHSGESIGFRNVIVRHPRRRLTVIVLTNRNDPEPYRMALAIARSARPTRNRGPGRAGAGIIAGRAPPGPGGC